MSPASKVAVQEGGGRTPTEIAFTQNQRPNGDHTTPTASHARRRPDLTIHLFEVVGLQPTLEAIDGPRAPESKSADRPGHGRAACRPGLRPAADPRRRARATPSAHARRIFTGGHGARRLGDCCGWAARGRPVVAARLAEACHRRHLHRREHSRARRRAMPPRPRLVKPCPCVYQCEGPCLLRPAPRRPAPTRGIGPAGHWMRPPRLGRCAGARRHLPNRLSDPASVQAQTGAGLRSRRGRRVQTPPDGPTAPLARLRRAAAAIREGRPNVEGSGVRGYELRRTPRALGS